MHRCALPWCRLPRKRIAIILEAFAGEPQIIQFANVAVVEPMLHMRKHPNPRTRDQNKDCKTQREARRYAPLVLRGQEGHTEKHERQRKHDGFEKIADRTDRTESRI